MLYVQQILNFPFMYAHQILWFFPYIVCHLLTDTVIKWDSHLSRIHLEKSTMMMMMMMMMMVVVVVVRITVA
jgi:hypothetical protein